MKTQLQIHHYESRIASHLDQFDSNKDYYSVLGARQHASRREIESLYRRLARQRHPDRGGNEDEMKALNEAYRVLHDDATRSKYDLQRQIPAVEATAIHVTPAVREVGIYGQLLSAVLCLLLGLLLLLLVRFNGLWFLWPLSILALGVILFAVLMAHSAMTNARKSLRDSHPARRFRAAQEILFWSAVGGGGYGVYLILTAI
ncbi:MAG TPA: DnaJ domain-containing protein [Pyrinomonadaceae bacterium]|nr:DnaJ domain-containing protein [Pyrinomonadaceae bacterium]